MASLFCKMTGAAYAAAMIGLLPMAAHATSTGTSSLTTWEASVTTPISETSTIAGQVSGNLLTTSPNHNILTMSSGYFVKIGVTSSAPAIATASSIGWNGSNSTVDDVIQSSGTDGVKFYAATGSYLPSSLANDVGFGFYVMPVASGSWSVTALASDGTSLNETVIGGGSQTCLTQSVVGGAQVCGGSAQFFGFYNMALGTSGTISLSATCIGTCGTESGLAVGDIFGAPESLPVPEPASIALLGAGLAGLGAVRRRFRR